MNTPTGRHRAVVSVEKLTAVERQPTLLDERPMNTSERLRIKNFGPIRQADIEVRDITIFLGPQATGKSLAAQLLYFMRGIEELLIPESWGGGRIPGDGYIARQELAGKVSSLLANWLGISGISYNDTCIEWITSTGNATHEDRLELSNQINNGELAKINQSLATRVESGFKLSGVLLPISEEQVYIPAGRVLYSFIPPSLGMFLLSPRMRQDARWPGYINVFYQKLGSALQELYQLTRKADFAPFLDETLDNHIAQVMKGRLSFPDPDRISLLIKDKFAEAEGFSRSFGLDPLKLASGQMEQWPFWALATAALATQGQTRVFFDEPEAHLHPTAQISLLESIAYLARKNLRFVLTTHSPYVIYALNNFLMAQQVIDSGADLPSQLLADTALSKNQISAYRFTNEGNVESILDQETGLIITDELDDPAGRLNQKFSELQEILLAKNSNG